MRSPTGGALVIHHKEIPRRRLRVSRKPFHGHSRKVITNSNRPKAAISKRLPAPGFEVPFKPSRLLPSQKGGITLKSPRPKLSRMRNLAGIMLTQPSSQIIRKSNIPLPRMRSTPQEVDVVHATPE